MNPSIDLDPYSQTRKTKRTAGLLVAAMLGMTGQTLDEAIAQSEALRSQTRKPKHPGQRRAKTKAARKASRQSRRKL